MKRVLLPMIALLSLGVVPSVAGVTAAEAAVPRKAAVCTPFKAAGVKLQWSVVGTGWTCSSAKKWVSKLVGETVTASSAKITFTDGPKGFHCQGASNKTGHATVGACYKGTAAFPKSGFQWFG